MLSAFSLVLGLGLVLAAPLATAAPTANPHAANLTLTFAPYRTVACEQSFVPGQHLSSPVFNLTQRACVTAPFVFGSYFVQGPVGLPASTKCNLTIFEGVGCRAGAGGGGGKFVKELQLPFAHCEIPGFSGESVRLKCY